MTRVQETPDIYPVRFADEIAVAATLVATGSMLRVVQIRIKFANAPTTPEDLTIVHNSKWGPLHDVVERTVDPATEGISSVSWRPINGHWLFPGDSLDVAYTNTDTEAWGVEYVVEGHNT